MVVRELLLENWIHKLVALLVKRTDDSLLQLAKKIECFVQGPHYLCTLLKLDDGELVNIVIGNMLL